MLFTLQVQSLTLQAVTMLDILTDIHRYITRYQCKELVLTVVMRYHTVIDGTCKSCAILSILPGIVIPSGIEYYRSIPSFGIVGINHAI